MIVLNNVQKTFGERALLKNASFHCPEGAKIALIGNNGAGKTTLLNILCGFDKNFEGSITRPRELRLGYLPQNANPNPALTILLEALSGAKEVNTIRDERDALLEQMAMEFSQEIYDRYEFLEQRFSALNGYRLEEDARDLLRGLGFKEEDFDRSVAHLSGGWRMRVELAKMLLDQPNFLILDEPTNHLDLPSIEWFEGYLQKFKGTILFVSHDKDLLNRLSTHILHLRKGDLTDYKGNFDAFLEAFELKQAQSAHGAKHIKQQTDHIQQFVDRFRFKPSKARQVQSRLKMLSRLKSLEDTVQTETMADTMGLSLDTPTPSGKEVLKVKSLTIGYDKPLVKNMNFSVYKGQKVAILGANGLGKSTLLRTFLGQQAPLDGTANFGHNVGIGYFAQEHLEGLDEKQNVLENVLRSSPTMREVEARKLLASLGLVRDDVFKTIKILSGGEKSRTALACMLAKKPNTLFLDEPTNHLDLSAIEILAQALSDFEGTVVFISHNRSFIQAVATHVIYLKERGPVTIEVVEEA
ncbi:MAG: ATP-binding cassette domain-containing protein [Alphaproteobacteria bacterium]|nr:ATP-binding cassette domain-containing protein [Alphaproteobacteria bacterium]